jgi:hypothetical protein
MTRVSQTDQILLLLRERLQDLARNRSNARAGRTTRETAAPVARLRQAGRQDQEKDPDFRRSLVRAVLTEELGDQIGNDPSFHAIADDVHRILEASEEGRAMIEQAARQLSKT